MDREKLNQVLNELKEKYKDEWNKRKDLILSRLNEAKGILLRDDLTLEEINRFRDIWNSIPTEFRKLFNVFFPQDESERVRLYMNDDVRKLLRLASETDDDNFENKLSEIVSVMRNVSVENVNIATLSSLIAIVNPKMFMPITYKTVNKQFRCYFKLQIFWGGQSDPEKYYEFIKTVKNVANELEIENMLEVAFYLNKFELLSKIGQKFVEKANSLGLNISEDQLGRIYQEGGYRQLYIPGIDGRIHFEWYLRRYNNQDTMVVGIHIEYSDVNRNQQILNELLRYRNKLEELARDVGGELNILTNLKTYRWIHITRSCFELEDPISWATDTMIRLYKDFAQILEEAINRVNLDLKEKLKQILEKVKISEDELEIAKSLISEVRVELLSHIEELKEKDWESGWNILNKLNRIPYIDLRNIPQAFKHGNLPKILVDYIDKLRGVKDLEEGSKLIEETLKLIEGSGIKYIRLAQLLHLAHVVRPELFIPVTQWQISYAICYIYSGDIPDIATGQDLEKCQSMLHQGYGGIQSIFKLITELRSMAEEIDSLKELPENERTIKLSLVLYKYGKEPFPIEEYEEGKERTKKVKIDEKLKSRINQILNNKKQVILYGPPGTGKTWLAENYVKVETNDNKEFYEFVTFHPSYAYEEFVEGLRPKTDENGYIRYEIEDGIFKRMCKKAFSELLAKAGVNKIWDKNLPELTKEEKQRVKNLLENGNYPKFYLIIDEINRGDISKIFGELITLLEADKRLFAENEVIVTLPYSKTKFGVPPNLFIIGTMNTADRSIALIDVALRRRFGFIEIMPSYKVLINELGIENVESEKDAIEKIKSWNLENLREDNSEDIKKLAVAVLFAINERINKLYDRDHQIGHSYLLKLKKSENIVETLKNIWYHEIIPLLQEYFYDSPEKLNKVLNGKFVEVRDNYYEFKEEEDFIKALKEVAKEGGS